MNVGEYNTLDLIKDNTRTYVYVLGNVLVAYKLMLITFAHVSSTVPWWVSGWPNHPPTKSTLELLTKTTLNVPEWPSYSFDLNRLEHLWQEWKMTV